MGLLDSILFVLEQSKKDNDDSLTDEERKHLKEGYEPYNFEEEDTEDDDYYYEDDK